MKALLQTKNLQAHVQMYVWGIVCVLVCLVWNVPNATATEVAVDADVFTTNTNLNNGSPTAVWVSDQVGFTFYLGAEGDLEMASTTDGGQTWAITNAVDSVNTTDVVSYAIWWDGWTQPGTTTQYIHIATTDTSVDDTYYTRVDTTNGSKSTSVLATTQAGTCTRGTNCQVSITKARNNVLYMAAASAADRWVVSCSTTCTTAGNWSERANAFYGGLGDDYPILMPVNGNDNVMLVYWDISLDGIYYNIYSATSSSWFWATNATQTIATAKDDNTTYDALLFGMTHSTTTGMTGLVIVDDANDYTTQDHDINFYTYSTTTGWVARTNPVTTASGGLIGAKVSYDERNNTWYAIYGRRTTIGTATTGNIYFKTSTDNGVTWSVESAVINDNADDITGITTGLSTTARVGAWWNYFTAPRASDHYYEDVAAQINISGTLYDGAGAGSGWSIYVAVGTSTVSLYGASTSANSTWSVSVPLGHQISASTPILAYVDDPIINIQVEGTKVRAATLTKAAANAGDISGLDLHRYTLIVRHEGTGTSTTISDLAFYDQNHDTDIRYDAATDTPALTLKAETKLFIWPGKTFTASGTVTINAYSGASNPIPDYSGTLHIGVGATYVSTGTTTLGGNFIASSTAVYSSTSTLLFNATTTGKEITATTTSLGSTTFNGVNGNSNWSFQADATTTDITINGGTVTALNNKNLTITGNLTVNQAQGLTMGNGGTTTFAGNSVQTLYYHPAASTTNPHMVFTGTGEKIFTTNATSSNFIIGSTATVTTQSELTIFDHYTNNGTFRGGGAVWTARTAATENEWMSVAYGNGMFVAVSATTTGTSTAVMTSPDGVTWTAQSGAEANTWQSVTFGNGLFVAVSSDGANRVMTSPDGITWTPRSAAQQNMWYSVTYGKGVFVAVAIDGANQVMTSPDGVTWTAQTGYSTWGWVSVTYGNGKFVAVSDAVPSVSRVMTSSDGITWTAQSGTALNTWTSVAYGNGTFVAVASDGGSTQVMSSPDAVTWTARPTPRNTWLSVTYGNGVFVAVAGTTTGTSTAVMISADGLTWRARTAGDASFWREVTYGNGTFVAVGGAHANRVMTSSDATMTFRSDSTISGNLTGTSSLRNVNFWFSGTKTFANNASTTNLTIRSASTVIAPASLSIAGNYTASGTITHSGTTTFNGSLDQIATGTMTGANAFVTLVVRGDAPTTTFATAVTASQRFYASTSNDIMLVFAAGTTTTLTNTTLIGSSTREIDLRSTLTGTKWLLDLNGAYSIAYVDVKDSNACPTSGTTITSSNAINSGNTSCWFILPLVLSGTIYTDEGSTVLASAKTIGIAIGTSTLSVHASTSLASGAWNFSVPIGNTIAASTPILVWIDGDSNTRAALITKAEAASTDISGLDLYQNHLIVRHEGTGTSTTLTDLAFYDSTDDPDIQYTALSTSLSVATNTELYIWAGDTFSASGTVTVNANTSLASINDGSLHIASGASYISQSTTTVKGNYTNDGNYHGAGTLWTAQIPSAKHSWNTVAYGNGLFVSVGVGAAGTTSTFTIMTSSDGVTWTGRATPQANTWQSLTYGEGLFVAVSSNGTNRVMTSPDGISWTLRDAAEANAWEAVTYGNGLFVAVAEGGTNQVMTSPDGITWTARSSPASFWSDVTYGGGKFVAVGATGPAYAMISTDGITWATSSVPAQDWYEVTYGNGTYVVNGSGPNYLITSPDAVTWTVHSFSAGLLSPVTFGNGLFVGLAGFTSTPVYTSPDGITWTARESVGSGNTWTDITYGMNQFVAVGVSTNVVHVMTSGDGTLAFSGTDTQTIQGNLTATSSFRNTIFTGAGTKTFANSASTTHFTIASSSAAVTAPSTNLTIYGDYANSGTFTHNSGTTTFSGSTQTATGTMTGASAFGHLAFIEEGEKSFGDNASSSNFVVGSNISIVSPPHLSIAGNYVNGGVVTTSGAVWTAKTAAAANEWSEVTYGNGLFVAVAATTSTSTAVMTSPDGITWTARSAAEANEWQSITYGNGLFVAVACGKTICGDGQGNLVMTSPDGITWTARSAAEQNAWQSVAYGNGLFAAVSSNGLNNRIMTSPDGITWTARSENAVRDNTNWESVTYGNGRFVAVGGLPLSNGDNDVITSTDGITWSGTQTYFVVSDDLTSVTYGNGLFVAVGESGSSYIKTSPDGINWTNRRTQSDSLANVGWQSVTYSNGLFVAVAATTTATSSTVITSPDGVTWTNRTGAEANSWNSVTYGNGAFVAVAGDGANRVMISPDATTTFNGTSAQTLSGNLTATSSLRNTVFTGAGTKTFANSASTTNFVIQSDSGAVTAPSTNLSIAANYTNRGTFTHNSGTTTFSGMSVQTATGTMTGTSAFNNVAFTETGEKIIASNASSTNLFTSSEAKVRTQSSLSISGQYKNDGTFSGAGAVWSLQSAASSNQWVSVTYGNGLFVAVSDNNTSNQIMTSPDGVNWTSQTELGTQDFWEDITYGNGLFVAVSRGNNYYVMTSPDGINWTNRDATAASWNSVTYGNDLFVAIGGGNKIMTSPDGITWTATTTSFTVGQAIAYGGGKFVVSGLNEVITSTNGNEWSRYPLNGGVNVLTYGAGRFVGMSTSPSVGTIAKISYDGMTWVTATTSRAISSQDITYGNGRFVAVSNIGFESNSYYMTSPDGYSWEIYSAPAANNWYGVTYGNGVFTAVSYNGSGTSKVMTSVDATTTFNGTSAQTIAGNLTATSSLRNTVFTGAGTKTFANNASTTHFTIAADSGAVIAPTSLSIAGNYSNSGTFTHNSGTTTFNGASAQIATGTMTGSSAFGTLILGGDAPTTTFGAPFAASQRFLASTSNDIVLVFADGATTTLTNATIIGSSTSGINLRSTEPGTQWLLDLDGSYVLAYLDVQDSNACPTTGTYITHSNVTDGGNTSCWFNVLEMYSAENQTFVVGQATTTISPITIDEGSLSEITDVNGIRIVIASTSVNMRFDTSDVTASFGGTAASKVSNPVSYAENGTVLIIPVSNSFNDDETLTISGLSYSQFASVNAPVSALRLSTDGTNSGIAVLDTKTVAITGYVTLSNHSGDQVDEQLDFPNESNMPLFAFNLGSYGEGATITPLTFAFSGVNNMNSSDITNARLYRDINGNKEYDASDVAVGGAGSVSIGGMAGTITFSTGFLATTSRDYILVVDTTNISHGDRLTVQLRGSQITAVGTTSLQSLSITGSADPVSHYRGLSPGGGYGEVGGRPSSGQGTRTGGDNDGGSGEVGGDTGESLGSTPGFNAPSIYGAYDWTNPGNTFVSDGVYTTASASFAEQNFGGFNFNIPANNTVTGIVVKIEAKASAPGGTISVRLMSAGGGLFTSYVPTQTLTTSDVVYTLGSPSSLWGVNWTLADFSDANFFVEVSANPSSNTLQIDAIQVRVYHQASGAGGGGGGGGEVSIPSGRYFALMRDGFGNVRLVPLKIAWSVRKEDILGYTQ